MASMPLLALAAAIKLTGELTVLPAVGEQTVTELGAGVQPWEDCTVTVAEAVALPPEPVAVAV